MLSIAIAGCVVFIAVLISSYWWGYHSKFSLGSRLVDAKESSYLDGYKEGVKSDAEVLEFDYVFERNRKKNVQSNSAPKSTLASTPASAPISTQEKASVSAPITARVSEPKAVQESGSYQSPKSSSVVSLHAHRANKQSAERVKYANNAAVTTVASSGEKDDLKKIWGIGVVFENLLNSMNINTFEELANISDEDKESVRESLGIYSARIERDAWVSQATAFAESKNRAQRIA